MFRFPPFVFLHIFWDVAKHFYFVNETCNLCETFRLKKLYIDMDKFVQVDFTVGTNPPQVREAFFHFY